MSKILFTGINARYVHSNPAILYLKKTISDLDFHSSVVEFTINESLEKILERIVLEKPDIIVLSVYIWNSSITKLILPELKRFLPGSRIIAGGPEVSYNAADWLKLYPEIDYIITGGGEAGFRELALSDFKHQDRIIRKINYSFNEVAFPYDDEEMKRLSGRFIYYESSRGCPFKCSYCLSSRSDQRLEFRSLEQVESELDFFCHHKPRLVKFVDRTFNSSKEHCRGVWEYIMKNFSPATTRFHFEIYPDLLEKDDFDFLETVPRGLFQFEMGIQTLRDETLSVINRNLKKNGWMEKVRALAEKGNIHLHVDLIAGLPYESYSDFKTSFNPVYSLGADHFQCGFLKILPGTEMSERSAEFGIEYDAAPPYQVKKNFWMGCGEIHRLEDMTELIEIYHNSGRFRVTENFLIENSGTPFDFYERLSTVFRNESPLNYREWEGAAELLKKFAEQYEIPDIPVFFDCLRWDWCSSMKKHHYPEILKSEATVFAKRRGYNYIIKFFHGDKVIFKNIEFSLEELRRSIFFTAGSGLFKERTMDGDYAMFLPDKRVIFFNIE